MSAIKTTELESKNVFDKISLKGIVYGKRADTTKTKNFYFWLSIMDKFGTVTFPVFSNAEARFEKIQVGDILTISGSVSEFNNMKNIKPEGFLVDEDGDHLAYTPQYSWPDEVYADFESIVDGLASPYKEFAKRAVVGNPDFLLAPAAESGHHNKIGGLFIHTYSVVKNIQNMISMYSESWRDNDLESVLNADRLLLSAMCHDIEKTVEYEFKKGIYRKDNVALDHTKSFCAYADKINASLEFDEEPALSEEDLLRVQRMVMAHHGPWGSPQPKNLEETLLHLADMIDSKVEQCTQSKDETYRINFSTKGMISAMER